MDPRIVFVTSIVSCDLRSELDLAGLARSVNLSTSRLRHLFRAEHGMTVSQFQRAMRLDVGRELLATTFLSVKEIMNSVGFSDPSFFSHEFRKANGMSPTGYRNHLRISALESAESLSQTIRPTNSQFDQQFDVYQMSDGHYPEAAPESGASDHS